MKRILKIFGVGLMIMSSVLAGFWYVNKPVGDQLLQNSVYRILESFANQGLFATPDLKIDKVEVKKLSDPTDSFNYYRYATDVYIENSGGHLSNAVVTLSNENDDEAFVLRNEEGGFSLKKGETFVLRNYEVRFDGRYNGGSLAIEMNVPNKGKRVMDENLEDNRYEIEFLEAESGLKNLRVSEVLNDGTVALDFDASKTVKQKYNFEVLTKKLSTADEIETEYAEADMDEGTYSYYKADNSKEVLQNESWESEEMDYLQARFLDAKDGKYVYLKATDPTNGNFIISDLLGFSGSESMNRAEFAKLFLELAEIEISDEGDAFYLDVAEDEWYFPYVQTLYNSGLIDVSIFYFFPDQEITRAEVLKIAMHQFDVNLASRVNRSRFKDVASDDEIFPYTQAFYALEGAKNLADNFNPEGPATRDFLKHLIYVLKKNY